MILNITKQTVVADSYERAVSDWEQVRGLMFRKVSPMLFCFGKGERVHLHSWFCRDSLDLILLDEGWEVVELVREWGPWKTFRSRRNASFLLELPAGCIFRSKTELGDIIHIK